MSKFPFNVGDRVEVKRELLHETGFITFIDTAYFTLCVREWEDKGKKNGVGPVSYTHLTLPTILLV